MQPHHHTSASNRDRPEGHPRKSQRQPPVSRKLVWNVVNAPSNRAVHPWEEVAEVARRGCTNKDKFRRPSRDHEARAEGHDEGYDAIQVETAFLKCQEESGDQFGNFVALGESVGDARFVEDLVLGNGFRSMDVDGNAFLQGVAPAKARGAAAVSLHELILSKGVANLIFATACLHIFSVAIRPHKLNAAVYVGWDILRTLSRILFFASTLGRRRTRIRSIEGLGVVLCRW
mmetsp:Transcript_44829/g.96323  ORF Transcript_44829/g.96323 Transcript_44829/m.96323 type:complete len:231 (-) Transcript_44829:439-1131(-)